jgi:hypothetical protein
VLSHAGGSRIGANAALKNRRIRSNSQGLFFSVGGIGVDIHHADAQPIGKARR